MVEDVMNGPSPREHLAYSSNNLSVIGNAEYGFVAMDQHTSPRTEMRVLFLRALRHFGHAGAFTSNVLGSLVKVAVLGNTWKEWFKESARVLSSGSTT